jgi:dihydrofolate reductase
VRQVLCSLSMSLDGYISGPDGSFDWAEPDPEVFALATDEVRGLSAHLLGRRLYEAMRYWERPDVLPSLEGPEREFADLWNALDKVVFSRTLTSVEGSYRLATAGLAEEVARLRAGPGEGGIAVGGPTLAASAAGLGLVDAYQVRVYPVLVGGGTPMFPQAGRKVDLELLESRPVGAGGVVYLRHRVRR